MAASLFARSCQQAAQKQTTNYENKGRSTLGGLTELSGGAVQRLLLLLFLLGGGRGKGGRFRQEKFHRTMKKIASKFKILNHLL